MRSDHLKTAHLIAFLVPFALIAGALGFQFIGGLHPCEMCHWQRWPHYTAIVIALIAFVVPDRRLKIALVALAGLSIATSGVIGVMHTGVENKWWPGFTACTGHIGSGSLADIMAAPIIPCDVVQWKMFGISMAGYNAIISLISALVIWGLLLSKRRMK